MCGQFCTKNLKSDDCDESDDDVTGMIKRIILLNFDIRPFNAIPYYVHRFY
jgi:hypothetical protein